MLRWRLSISAACRLQLARRALGPMAPLAAALAALAATLALGLTGTPTPHFRSMPITIAILPAIAGTGLIAWHFARLTTFPLADARLAALIAALVPALTLPGIGANALFVPAALALCLLADAPHQRVVALMVQCGALAALAAPAVGDFSTSFTYATMLGVALFLAARSLSGAANDNPSMERVERFAGDSRLKGSACYANADSIPGKWGVS